MQEKALDQVRAEGRLLFTKENMLNRRCRRSTLLLQQALRAVES
jgi:hypothetical protein